MAATALQTFVHPPLYQACKNSKLLAVKDMMISRTAALINHDMQPRLCKHVNMGALEKVASSSI